MKFYTKVPMYPGPTAIHPKVREALAMDYAPPRTDDEYSHIYKKCVNYVQTMLNTKNDVVFMSGEAMLGLWSALKSTLKAKDKVLVIGTGIFGDGFKDMADVLNCETKLISFPYNSTIKKENLAEIEQAIIDFKPKAITIVHCETPSGTLNPLEDIGKLKAKHNVPLLIVDAVASIGGVPIFVDDWHIDVLLGGSQKCLSAPADITIMAVSNIVYEIAKEINYIGYDALLPFIGVSAKPNTAPYTPNCSAMAGIFASLDAIFAESLKKVYTRHEEVAEYCRNKAKEMGLELWVEPNSLNSPTVSAFYIPKKYTWEEFYKITHDMGLELATSLGSLHGKIFRLGHMGVQADKDLIFEAMEIIKKTL